MQSQAGQAQVVRADIDALMRELAQLAGQNSPSESQKLAQVKVEMVTRGR